MLLGLVFSRLQIVKIVGRNGGAQIVASVVEYGPALVAAGYGFAYIVNIVRSGGSQSLGCIVQYCHELVLRDFTPQDIATITADTSGSTCQPVFESINLPSVLAHANCNLLADALGEIDSIVVLERLIRDCSKLESSGYSHQQLQSIFARYNGACSLKALSSTEQTLREFGFFRDNLVAIAAKLTGGTSLYAAVRYHSSLFAAGFTHADIEETLTAEQGAKSLSTLAYYHGTLFRNGMDRAAIVRTAKQPDGAQALVQLAHEGS